MKIIQRKMTYSFNGTALRLRLAWGATENLTISTGYAVDRVSDKGKLKWKNNRCVAGTVHGRKKIAASVINIALQNLEDSINSVFYEYEHKEIMPTREEIRIALSDSKDIRRTDFAYLYQIYLADASRTGGWSYNTLRSARQVGNLVMKKSPHLKVDHITASWLQDFVEYQKTHRLSEKSFSSGSDGYANNVIRKNCRILGWFIDWAVKARYIRREAVENFEVQLKTITKPVIFLTWDELMKIWSIDLEPGSPQDRARDLFCFQCFTSLRYSDVAALTKSQITQDIIHVTTVKTGKVLDIDINKWSRAILDKYKNIDGERALPFLTNFRLNWYLKKVAKKAGIDTPVTISQYYGNRRIDRTQPKHELISSHCGRRTFICSALAMGIAPNIVMKWTGHSEYSAMRPYIDIADDIRRKAMSAFDEA